MIYWFALIVAVAGMGFIAWLRLSGKKEGKLEVINDTQKKAIDAVKVAQTVDAAVTRLGDGTVYDELRTDWTRK